MSYEHVRACVYMCVHVCVCADRSTPQVTVTITLSVPSGTLPYLTALPPYCVTSHSGTVPTHHIPVLYQHITLRYCTNTSHSGTVPTYHTPVLYQHITPPVPYPSPLHTHSISDSTLAACVRKHIGENMSVCLSGLYFKARKFDWILCNPDVATVRPLQICTCYFLQPVIT